MGALTVLGSGGGAYIMATAVLSPCPPLVDKGPGGAIIVSIRPACLCQLKHEKVFHDAFSAAQVLAWVAFVLTLSYVKVIVGVILRDEGHSALVWCGAVVQLGSLLGAVTMFPMVSVYNLFSSGDPCNTKCP